MRLALLFFDGLSSWFLIIDLLKGSQYPGIGFNILEHATIVNVKEDSTKQNRNRSTIGFIKSGGTIKNRNFSTCGYVKVMVLFKVGSICNRKITMHTTFLK